MLKAIGWLSLPLLLSACATTPETHGSNLDAFGPRSSAPNYSYQSDPGLTDQRLFDPHFYMDDDATPRWMLGTERPIR
ncbi:MAG TPA: hypothetical protein VLW55_16470 [Burkholderiaceae bacterium]|nr:hypothetical protein [Burkholderiaceae bacterium]